MSEANPLTSDTPINQPTPVQTVARYDFFISIDKHVDLEELEVNNILDATKYVIDEEFTNQVQDIFQGMVDVKIIKLEQGSINGTVILILATGVSLYQFLAQYRDFYESLILLRQHFRSLLIKVMRKFPIFANTNVVLTKVPILTSTPISKSGDLESTRKSPLEPTPLYSKTFFWYLFFMNLILMGIIAVLVYRAVVIAYFGSP